MNVVLLVEGHVRARPLGVFTFVYQLLHNSFLRDFLALLENILTLLYYNLIRLSILTYVKLEEA